MKIDNATQFVSLLRRLGMNDIHHLFSHLTICNRTYTSLCPCATKVEKLNKYRECNKLYRESVSVLSTFGREVFTKIPDIQISFYMDGGLINTMSR